MQEISGGTVRWTDTYSYEYSLQDGYLETKVTGTSSDRNRRASETLSSYDGWGRRTSLEERTNLRDFKQTLRSARYFAYDAEGGLISRREGELVEVQGQTLLQFRQARKEDARFKNLNPVPHLIEQTAWNAMSAGEREHWAGVANTRRYSFANGQLLGSVSEAGQMSVGDRLTGFENSSLGTSTVVVRSGETLRSVAQRIYGDGSLWYVLADANGLTNSDETLAEAQNLQVPQVGTTTNSASTFKPFDPSEQIGPTAPSLPTIAPPPKNSCNPIAQLLMVIVSVAVSFVTYGASSAWAASTFGLTQGGIAASAIGGAIAGAAGATASGVVGSVTGVASFSWRNVASNAVGSAITAGLGAAFGPSIGLAKGELASVGKLLEKGRPLMAAGMALGNAAAGYIGNKVAGVQGTSFSWRNIAGSAVGSMISSAAFNKLGWTDPGKFEVGGSFGQNLVTGFVGGLVSAHMQKAFGAEVNVNEGRMALDAFGNAIGNALGGGIDLARQRREFDRQMGMFNERARQSTDERMKGLIDASAQRVNDLLDARIAATANDLMAKTAEKMAARDLPMLGLVTIGPLQRTSGVERAAATASAVSQEEFHIQSELARDAEEEDRIQRADGWPLVQAMKIARAQQGPEEMLKTFTMLGPGLGVSFALGGGPLWARVLGASPGLWSAGNDIADGHWVRGLVFGGLEVLGVHGLGLGSRVGKQAAIADAAQSARRINQASDEAALAHAIADGRLSKLFGNDEAAVARWDAEIKGAWVTARRDWLAPIAAGKMHETLTMAAVQSNVMARSAIGETNFVQQVTLRVTDASGKSSIIRADGLERVGNSFVIHEAKFSLSNSLTDGVEGLRAMFTTRQRHAFDALQQPGVKVEVLGDKLVRAGFNPGSTINVLPRIQMHVNSAIGPLTRGWP